MTDRPIIFSGPMVRAMLAGQKTQTRRLATSPLNRCEAGDRLWAREAWAIASIFTDVAEVRYRASERASHTEFVEQVPVDRIGTTSATWPKYRPSIHMPRWASRLTLVVEGVRIERLQAITTDDVIAEGAPLDPNHHDTTQDGSNPVMCVGDRPWTSQSPHAWYHRLWDSLHRDVGTRWDDNPDVVALTFGVVRSNIDQVSA